jgi:hypothetical protein
MTVKAKKNGNFDDIYIKGATAYWAKVQEPQTNQFSGEKEYSITLFVDAEDAATLEDDVKLNKAILEAHKGKNTKRKVAYPEDYYPNEGGKFGIKLSMKEFAKSGRKNTMTIVDAEGEEFTDNIGNGSTVNIKFSGYRNNDDLLCVTSIGIVQVTDLVEYTSGGGDAAFDEELGIKIKLPQKEKPVAEVVAEEFSDDVPF